MGRRGRKRYRKNEEIVLKYIDYVKRIISTLRDPKLIRFPIERTIKEDDPKTKRSKKRFWKALNEQRQYEQDLTVTRIPRGETSHEEWLRGYRKWKKSQKTFEDWKEWKQNTKKK